MIFASNHCMYNFSKFIIISIVSMQLAFSAVITDLKNIERSPANSLNIKELNKILDDFFIKVWGKKTKSCKSDSSNQYQMILEQMMSGKKEQSYEKSEFDIYLDQLEVNSCSDDLYFKKSKIKNDECKEERTSGIIGNVNNSVDEGEVLGTLNRLYREAKIIKNEVEIYVNQHLDERSKVDFIIKNYIKNIVITFHDLSILHLSINQKRKLNYVRFLSLRLSDDFLANYSDLKNILSGSNDFGPYFFKINDDNEFYVDSSSTIQRDIITLLRYPSKERFTLALRWQAISMLMIQLRFQAKLMDRKIIKVPSSCKTNTNNNLMNEDVISKYNVDQNIENLLLSNKLITNLREEKSIDINDDENTSDVYNNSFLEDLFPTPMNDGGEPITPIENFNYSMRAIHNSNDVDIDDYLFFEDILNYKYSEYKKKFLKSDGWYWIWQSKNYLESKAFTFFEKLITFPENQIFSIKTKDNRLVKIDSSIQQYTKFIFALLQDRNVETIEELISNNLKKKLTQNNVLIDFPKKFGSLVNRNWATTLLRDTVLQNEGNPSLEYWLKASFREVRKKDSLWLNSKKFNYNQFRILFSGLVQSNFLPISFYKKDIIKKYWPFFSRLWRNLRDFTTLLNDAKLNEYDYLMAQVEANNPWANSRLSYLLAIEQLENKKEKRLSTNEQLSCFKGKIDSVLAQVKQAGSVLKLNSILKPSHGNIVLSKDEKKKLWINSLEKLNNKFANILNEEFGGTKINSMLDKLVGSEVNSMSAVEKFEQNLSFNISPSDFNLLDEFNNSISGKKTILLTKLYNTKGDLDKQISLMDEYSNKYGVVDSVDSREILTRARTIYKLPLYKSIIKRGSISKYLSTLNNLQHLCSSQQDDFESTKDFYFSTIKAQNKLNSILNLPIVPNKDIEKIQKTLKDDMESFSPEEVTDFFLAGAMIVTSIGAMTLGSACTVASGGLCLPLGGAMGAFGVATMGIQIELFSNELGRLLRSYESVSEVERYSKSGLTDLSQIDTVSRSKAWTIIEGISIIPFIGLTTKSLKGGVRIVSRGSKDFIRGNKSEIGIHARQILAEEDIMFAKHVAGLNYGIENASADMLEALKQLKNGQWTKAKDKIFKIKKLFKSGKLSKDEFLTVYKNLGEELAEGLAARGANAKKMVLETLKEKNHEIAIKHSMYFNNSFKKFDRFVKSYTRKLPHAKEVLNAIDSGKSKMRFIPFANWYRGTRYRHLVKYGDDLENISKELKLAQNNGESLESFIEKRADLFTDIFSEIPMRKRDVPYAFLLSGGAHMGGLMGGKGLPFFSNFAAGLVMRKLYSASARLNYEVMATAAKKALNIEVEMATITAGESIRAFRNHFNKTLPTMTRVMQKANKKQMKAFQTKVAKLARTQAQKYFEGNKRLDKVFRMFNKGKVQAFKEIQFKNLNHIKKILFNPETTQERVMFDLLWSKLDRNKILKMEDLGEMAHSIARHLSKLDSKTMFESLRNSLMMISITKNPAIVEIM